MTEVFDDLFVEKDELNETILKGILSNNIKMTSGGDVIFQKELDPKLTILVYLLANKVFVIKKLKTDEAEGPKEIHLKTGVAEGTVKRYVRDLQKEGLLVGKKGKYFVPNHSLQKIKKLVIKDEDKSSN